MPAQTRIVDNRVFLLGLDQLYHERMKLHESEELLRAARSVCRALSVEPYGGPVEGYYAESDALAEYFRRMRALRDVPERERPRVQQLPEFRRLLEVCGAPLYGEPLLDGRLLPKGSDPLSQALEDAFPDWTIDGLVSASFDRVSSTDDFSLVGLAALAKDAVVLAALRESAVLYAHWVLGAAAAPVTFVYEWAVDPMVAERAERFIATFNDLFHETLPPAISELAELFWNAFDESRVFGRCVRLGADASMTRHYHWAVTTERGNLIVRDFWSTELWTTERFNQALANPETLPFPASV